MSDENDPEVLTPLKNLTIEITRRYVSQLVKESTKQAIRKQGTNLSKSQLHKFQDKIKNMSDKDKLEKLKEPLEEVQETITQKEISEKTLEQMSDKISKGFETKITLGMTMGSKAAILTAVIIFGVIFVSLFLYPGTEEQMASTISSLTTVGDNNTTVDKNRTICPKCTKGILTYEVEVNEDCPNCEYGTVEPDTPYCDNCGDKGYLIRIEKKTEICTYCKGDGFLDTDDPGYTV